MILNVNLPIAGKETDCKVTFDRQGDSLNPMYAEAFIDGEWKPISLDVMQKHHAVKQGLKLCGIS